MPTRPSDDPRYHTARWRKVRDRVVARDGRRCAEPGCRTNMLAPGETHIDHIVDVPPHAPDSEFFDESNLWVLCKRHHFAKSLDVAASGGAAIRSPNA